MSIPFSELLGPTLLVLVLGFLAGVALRGSVRLFNLLGAAVEAPAGPEPVSRDAGNASPRPELEQANEANPYAPPAAAAAAPSAPTWSVPVPGAGRTAAILLSGWVVYAAVELLFGLAWDVLWNATGRGTPGQALRLWIAYWPIQVGLEFLAVSAVLQASLPTRKFLHAASIALIFLLLLLLLGMIVVLAGSLFARLPLPAGAPGNA